MLALPSPTLSTAALLAALCAVPVSAQEPGACPAPGAPVAEPYRWYPALDLARIPFHRAAGPWGPRAPISAPEAPVTRRTVRVTSASQLGAAALMPGTTVIVDAEFIGPAVLLGDVTDVDIVVPRGKTVAQLMVGRHTPPSTTRRVRIRGETPGTHSGGRIGRIVFYSNPASDLIIDGVDLNGEDGEGGNLLLQFTGVTERVAVVNVRGHGVGAGTLGGQRDMVFAGNRIKTGARPGPVNGYPEGWGIRGGDSLVVYDNRIDGVRYHRVRVHPGVGPPQYAWIANNTFTDPHEGRIFTAADWNVHPSEKGRSRRTYAAVWAVCNAVHAHSTCIPASFEAPDADYALLTGNRFYGSITRAGQERLQAAHGRGRDYLSGNSFSPWRAPPDWTAPGDPGAIPLPAVKPERHNRAVPVIACPPP